VNSLNGMPVRILHLEDVQDESIIVEDTVRRGGVVYDWKWVDSKERYRQALCDFQPDIVLSDHSMPGFTSAEAFRTLK